MKKRLFFSLLYVVLAVVVIAQEPHKVVFYNLENFFDTIHDPRVRDDEFTPQGAKRWDTAKYAQKRANIERVLFDLAAPDGHYPVVIGVAEVENRSVLEDLVAAPTLAKASYGIVHYDSPEARGVDVAFLYRPDCFVLQGSRAVRTVVPQLPNFKTRDILTMWGTMDKEPFFFLVAHLPSRLGGEEASEFKRLAVGEQMRRIADSVRRINPRMRIVAMGDFNDDPTNRSMTEGLGAKGRLKEVDSTDFYNPFVELFKAGQGTLAYGGAWNLFDQIVVSRNLAVGAEDGYRLLRMPDAPFDGAIFRPLYLIERDGKFKGHPLRTYGGNHFQGGFSDHLPVYIYLGKSR